MTHNLPSAAQTLFGPSPGKKKTGGVTRFGIAEWYGQCFEDLSVDRRKELSAVALEGRKRRCPFRAMNCNKPGGVCSIQRYSQGTESASITGPPVIVCPVRFEQNRVVLSWLAEIVGFELDTARVAREVSFLRNPQTGRPAGKVDLIVANDGSAQRWYGLEIQAVYFSGDAMDKEFRALRTHADPTLLFPVGTRRPDWRSSSAKRLMPQLSLKAPTLQRWNSKLAVAVDRPFFDALGGPSENPSQDINDGDIIWLVPELVNGELRRGHWEVLTLKESEEKLLSGDKVKRDAFEANLRSRLVPLVEA